MIGMREFSLIVDEEEVEAIIDFQESMRDDAIGSCEDEEAERRRLRINHLREVLRQWRRIR